MCLTLRMAVATHLYMGSIAGIGLVVERAHACVGKGAAPEVTGSQELDKRILECKKSVMILASIGCVSVECRR